MKKVLLTALAVTSMISSAHAGALNLDMRADYTAQNYNEDAGSANTAKYYFKTIRLNYEGKVNDDLSFRLRAAYNKDATKLDLNGDTSVKALEYAYLTHKMSDMFSLQIGRLYSEVGAFEGAAAGPDLYLTSQAFSGEGVGANGELTKNWLSTKDLQYVTGAKLMVTVAEDNTVSLVSFKAPISGSNSKGEQNALMTGLAYKGAFMDKTLKVMAAYHVGNGTDSSKDKYTLMSAGVSYAADPVTVGLDYLTSDFKQDVGGKKDAISSIVAKVAYTGLEQITPRLEYVSSENKLEIDGTATDKYSGFGAVVEFNPYNDYKGFRYHVAYHNMKADKDAATTSPTVEEITVGARLYADFLK